MVSVDPAVVVVEDGQIMKQGKALLSLGALVAVAMLGGCSEPSAADKVCDARAELDNDIEIVVGSVREADLGAAQGGVEAVRSSAGELRDAVAELASEQREALAPAVDDLQSDIQGLTDVSSIADFGEQIQTVTTQSQSIFDDIGSTLGCG